MAKTDEELQAPAREYGVVELTISKPPLVPRGEIMLLPGIRKPSPEEKPRP